VKDEKLEGGCSSVVTAPLLVSRDAESSGPD